MAIQTQQNKRLPVLLALSSFAVTHILNLRRIAYTKKKEKKRKKRKKSTFSRYCLYFYVYFYLIYIICSRRKYCSRVNIFFVRLFIYKNFMTPKLFIIYTCTPFALHTMTNEMFVFGLEFQILLFCPIYTQNYSTEYHSHCFFFFYFILLFLNRREYIHGIYYTVPEKRHKHYVYHYLNYFPIRRYKKKKKINIYCAKLAIFLQY